MPCGVVLLLRLWGFFFQEDGGPFFFTGVQTARAVKLGMGVSLGCRRFFECSRPEGVPRALQLGGGGFGPRGVPILQALEIALDEVWKTYLHDNPSDSRPLEAYVDRLLPSQQATLEELVGGLFPGPGHPDRRSDLARLRPA